MNPILDLDLVQAPDPEANRCVVFLRSGHTIKLDGMSASHVYRIIMESNDEFILLDGVPVCVAAIDCIEDISRINRKAG